MEINGNSMSFNVTPNAMHDEDVQQTFVSAGEAFDVSAFGRPILDGGIIEASRPEAAFVLDMSDFDDGAIESVSDDFLSSAGMSLIKDGLSSLGLAALEREAAEAFAQGGESAAMGALETLQNARTQVDRFGKAFSMIGQVDTLLSAEADVERLARDGQIEEANRHTFGTASRVIVDGGLDLLTGGASAVGLGDIAREAVLKAGLSEAAYGIGRGIGDMLWETELSLAVKLSELTGRELRPGVMEAYQRTQNVE